jgi:hypothetical protein
MSAIRESMPDLQQQFLAQLPTMSPANARAFRNEIIAQRMYAIDVQYSEYEAALTRERQEIGFAALSTAEGLNVAGTLITDGVTRGVLSGLAGGVTAIKGHYESDILLAKTVEIIQKQMRANRQFVAAHILTRMNQDIVDYPLAAALSDIEEYYRAGTLTSGIVAASTTVGVEERNAQDDKQTAALIPVRTTYVRDANSDVLIGYLYPQGKFSPENRDELRRILREDMRSNERLGRIVEGSYGTVLRAELARRAKQSKVLNQ